MEGKYLPIGSVCRLKGSDYPLMIIGFCVKKTVDDIEMHDYAGCPYPTGIISSEINFLFDHKQIEEILFRGFENEKEIEFKKQLDERMAKMGSLNTNELITQNIYENVNQHEQPNINFFNSSSNGSN